jgi:hypothetical protein
MDHEARVHYRRTPLAPLCLRVLHIMLAGSGAGAGATSIPAASHRVVDHFFKPSLIEPLQQAALELKRFISMGGEEEAAE